MEQITVRDFYIGCALIAVGAEVLKEQVAEGKNGHVAAVAVILGDDVYKKSKLNAGKVALDVFGITPEMLGLSQEELDRRLAEANG